MPSVPTGDLETYYDRRGDGPPLVFIHGAILDHAQWEPQLERLSENYTTIAYDVRGHGRTGRSAKESYSFDLFVEDLDALITDLDLDQPVLCGLSTGGCIAQAYAATHPDRLAGLVLADTFTAERLHWSEHLQLLLLRAAIPPVRLVGYQRVEKALVWLQERFQKGASGDYEQIERLRAEGPKMETEEFAKVIRALVGFSEMDIDLSAIDVPTLILYGENEPAFIRRHVPKLASELQNASVRMVPGAGHASNLDNPDFFTNAVQEFLAESVFDDQSDGPDETVDSEESG